MFFLGLSHSPPDPVRHFSSSVLLDSDAHGRFSISSPFKKTISFTFARAIRAFNHPTAPDLCICTKLSGTVCLHPAVVKVLSSYFSSLDANNGTTTIASFPIFTGCSDINDWAAHHKCTVYVMHELYL